MAQNLYAQLGGTKVAVPCVAGPFRACKSCGHTMARVSAKPIGMHAGSLTCDACGTMTAYLSRDHMAAMLAQRQAERGPRDGKV